MSAATRQALAYGDEWLAKTIEGLETERDELRDALKVATIFAAVFAFRSSRPNEVRCSDPFHSAHPVSAEGWTLYRFTNTVDGTPTEWRVAPLGGAPTPPDIETVDVVPQARATEAEGALQAIADGDVPIPDGGEVVTRHDLETFARAALTPEQPHHCGDDNCHEGEA